MASESSARPQTTPEGAQRILAWLEAHGRGASPLVGTTSRADAVRQTHHVLPLDLTKTSVHVFDLSTDSQEFPNGPDPEDAEGWTSLLFDKLDEVRAEVGVGRYDEVRQWYTSDIFRDPTTDPPEWRTVHLGIDLFLRPGTPVLAPFDAVVHSVANNVGNLDYGPTVVLEHQFTVETEDTYQFWTLFGHLAEEEVSQLSPGQRLSRGEPFVRIGDFPVNGNWAPHLHFQIIADLLGMEGNFPGVALPSQRALWLALSPDPNLILGIPDLSSP